LSGGFTGGTTSAVTVADSEAFGFGSGDFTIEGWFYSDNPSATSGSLFSVGTFQDGVLVRLSGASGDPVYLNGTTYQYAGGHGFPTSRWTHVAVVRKAGILSVYVGGQQKLSVEAGGDIGSSRPLFIGAGGHTYNNSQYAASEAWVGYVDDIRVVKGLAVYDGSYVPPASPLSAYATPAPLEAEASLLINFDDSVTDSSPSALQFTTPAGTFSTGNKKFGSAAYSQNSTTGLRSTTRGFPDISSGDWTIEFWVWIPAGANENVIKSVFGLNADPENDQWAGGMHIYLNNLRIYCDNGLTGNSLATPQMASGAWNHVAVTQSSGSTRIFLNGDLGPDAILSSVVPLAGPYFASIGHVVAFDSFAGNILLDDLRVVKGLAVYRAAFVPPTATLPVVASPIPTPASLLLNFDGSFADESVNGLTLTPVGSPAISTAEKQFGSGSLLLDGSSHLAGPHIDLSVGDCTIEFWFKALNGGGGQYATFFNNYVEAGSATLGGFGIYFNLYSPGSGCIGVWAFSNIVMSQSAYSDGEWHHVAVTKSGSYCTLYVDGVADGSGNAGQAFSVAGAGFRIGKDQPGINSQFQGYIDGFRITKGSLYCGAFTRPSSPPTPTAVAKNCPPPPPPDYPPYGTILYESCYGDPYYQCCTEYADGYGGSFASCGEPNSYGTFAPQNWGISDENLLVVGEPTSSGVQLIWPPVDAGSWGGTQDTRQYLIQSTASDQEYFVPWTDTTFFLPLPAGTATYVVIAAYSAGGFTLGQATLVVTTPPPAPSLWKVESLRPLYHWSM
jgi:hypothetical protein